MSAFGQYFATTGPSAVIGSNFSVKRDVRTGLDEATVGGAAGDAISRADHRGGAKVDMLVLQTDDGGGLPALPDRIVDAGTCKPAIVTLAKAVEVASSNRHKRTRVDFPTRPPAGAVEEQVPESVAHPRTHGDNTRHTRGAGEGGIRAT